MPSVAIAVVHHGRIIWEHAVGFSGVEAKRAATVRTPYYLASVSKTMTATAVMGLVAQGKVNLDRPVNTYLKSSKLTSPRWDVSKATVRRVLNHTAGLSTYNRDCVADDQACETATAAAIRRYGVVVWSPGERFDYSNLGYGILGQAVEDASNVPFGAALKSIVFAPLAMSNCSLGPVPDVKKEKAARYTSSPLQRSPLKISTTPGGSAVYCSVHDLAMFAMFHLKDHLPSQKKIMSDDAIDAMKAASPGSDEQQHYGLGWHIQDDLHGFRGVLAQGGTIDASAYLQLIPSEDLAVAMLANTGTADGNKIVDEALAAVLPRYRQELSRVGEAGESSPKSTEKTDPPEVTSAMVGTWAGFVQTYKGKVPLTVNIQTNGAIVAKLGSQAEVRVPHARFDGKAIGWKMPGSLGVEGEPFELDLLLYRDEQSLTGTAETRPAPTNRTGFRTYFWVQMEPH